MLIAKNVKCGLLSWGKLYSASRFKIEPPLKSSTSIGTFWLLIEKEELMSRNSNAVQISGFHLW
jgi:hypothetical protein